MVDHFDRQFMDPEAYLAWEATQPERHEYLDGEVYAMTGGTLPHNDLAINLTVALRSLLRGTGCKVRMADAKVQLDDGRAYFYPDVVVSCDGRDREATDAIRSPILIIEILSSGTASYDRGDKFKCYRCLSSLREYLLIDSTQISVDRYYLNDSGEWVLTSYPAVDWDRAEDWGAIAVELLSLGLQLTLGRLYEDVMLPPRKELGQPTA